MNREQRRKILSMRNTKRTKSGKPKNPELNTASINATNAQSTLDNLSVTQLAAGVNNLLMQLDNRGVDIRDWDHKGRKLHRLQMVKGQLYFLAAEENKETEGQENEEENTGRKQE